MIFFKTKTTRTITKILKPIHKINTNNKMCFRIVYIELHEYKNKSKHITVANESSYRKSLEIYKVGNIGYSYNVN